MKITRIALQLILVLLGIGGLGALRAQDAPDPTKRADYQKKLHAETLRLMESAKPEDRMTALSTLGGFLNSDMNYSLLWKLMNDTDAEVRLAAISTLTQFTCTMSYNISFEMAQKMATMLDQEVTPKCIKAAQDAVQPEMKIRKISMVTHSAIALIWLQGQHPIRTTAKAGDWHSEMLWTLFENLTNHLEEVAGKYDDLLYELMYQISDAETVMRALRMTLEKLKIADTTAERQRVALQAFWNHHLLGEGKLMNLLLLKELNQVWEPVKSHILGHLKEVSDQQMAAYYVRRIDEAYADARKQLAPQPAPNAQK